MALMKSCTGCGRLIPYGSSRCPDCEEKHQERQQAAARESKRERDRRYNQKRDRKLTAFYHSKEWQTLSRRVMADHHWTCDWCGLRAGQIRDDGTQVRLEVDHIIELSEPGGWEKQLDKTNLRVLCTKCHNLRHDRFQKRRE